jgi:hypothetical protein
MRIATVLCMALACVLATLETGDAVAGTAARQFARGRTGQRYRIVLRARERTIEIMRFTIRLSCRDGSTLVDEESGFQRTPLARAGQFRDDRSGSTDEVRIKGRLRGRRAKGRVRVSDKLGSGVRCDSHWVRFVALAPPVA